MPVSPAPSGRQWPLLDYRPSWPRAIALVLGVGAAMGFQPLGLWPIALLAAGGMVCLLARTQSWRQAAWLGWLFGWAHFTFSNNWIATSFTHQANMPAVLGLAAVPLLALYLAVYPALAAGAARALVRQGQGREGHWAFALTFAGCWIISEWLRAVVFTGYSWNPFAMVLLGPFDRPGLAAIAPVMGTYALSGLAMILGASLWLLAGTRRWRVLALVTAMSMAGMYWPAGPARDSDLAVTVVQPDIGQDRLNRPELYEDNYLRLARQSAALVPGQRRIVLWPESGMVDYLREGYPQRYYDATTALASPVYARRRLGRTVGDGSVLMTGAVDLEFGPGNVSPRAIAARNAVTVLSSDGEIVGSYAKAHLVPYGEYLPMRPLLEPLGLSRLVPGAIDFWPGPGPQTLDLGLHGKAGVQICYEIIFSGQVTQSGVRPDYIFNPSNDGWFGAFGPPQHLAQARMRAIEEALPVLRSTTTGISAIVDASGVVRQHLGRDRQGRLDAMVPQAGLPTLFSRLGNVLALLWAVVFLILGRVAMRRVAG